ncbi:hypothetical protein LCGC14_0491120 [marine sediment metagenome]|uniref:3-keto-disaccharide hydrolase domain-containing protein n=1 Tax=marine sediment metagenome TaxID=412755 RepID=A0A0F9SBS2_9ZZZZ
MMIKAKRREAQRRLLLFSGARPAIAYGTLLFVDLFNDSDGVGLDAHTPDLDLAGNGWVEQAGTWEIQGDTLELQDQVVADYAATVDIDRTTDFEVEFEITQISLIDHNIQLLLRYVDSSNLIRLLLFEGGDWDLQDTGGGDGLFANGAGLRLVVGSVVRVRLEANTFSVYHNDVLQGSGTSSSHSAATTIGIRDRDVDEVVQTRFDNFIVRE